MTRWLKTVVMASFLCSSLALAACAADDASGPEDLQGDDIGDERADESPGDEAVASEQRELLVYDSCTKYPGWGWQTICQPGGKPPCFKVCVCQSYICAN